MSDAATAEAEAFVRGVQRLEVLLVRMVGSLIRAAENGCNTSPELDGLRRSRKHLTNMILAIDVATGDTHVE